MDTDMQRTGDDLMDNLMTENFAPNVTPCVTKSPATFLND